MVSCPETLFRGVYSAEFFFCPEDAVDDTIGFDEPLPHLFVCAFLFGGFVECLFHPVVFDVFDAFFEDTPVVDGVLDVVAVGCLFIGQEDRGHYSGLVEHLWTAHLHADADVAFSRGHAAGFEECLLEDHVDEVVISCLGHGGCGVMGDHDGSCAGCLLE